MHCLKQLNLGPQVVQITIATSNSVNLTLHKGEVYSIPFFFIPCRLQQLFTASLSFTSSSNFLCSLYYFLDHVPSKLFLPGLSCCYRGSLQLQVTHSPFKTSCLSWHVTPDPFQYHHHFLLLIPIPFNSQQFLPSCIPMLPHPFSHRPTHFLFTPSMIHVAHGLSSFQPGCLRK